MSVQDWISGPNIAHELFQKMHHEPEHNDATQDDYCEQNRKPTHTDIVAGVGQNFAEIALLFRKQNGFNTRTDSRFVWLRLRDYPALDFTDIVAQMFTDRWVLLLC